MMPNILSVHISSRWSKRLKVELSPSPMPPLGVVLDGGCKEMTGRLVSSIRQISNSAFGRHTVGLETVEMNKRVSCGSFSKCNQSMYSPEPLGNGSVLPGGLGQLLLNPESLLGRLWTHKIAYNHQSQLLCGIRASPALCPRV